MPDPIQIPEMNLSGTEAQSQSQPETNESSLANPFLEAIDPNDRPIVEKYIKDWDTKVSSKFQEIHEQYKPWKELDADPDTVKAALSVMRLANEDPYAFYNYVGEQLKELGLMPEENGFENQNDAPVGGGLPEFEGLPEPFVQKFKGIEDTLNKVSSFIDNFQKEQERTSQQQLLDKTLSELENKHGKFDEDAVIGRIIKGMTPEEAVKDWKNFMNSLNSGPQKTPPPSFGGGRIPAEQVDGNKIKDPKTRKQLVAELLGE